MSITTVGRALALAALVAGVAAGCTATDDDDDTSADGTEGPASQVEGESDEVDDVRIAACTENTVGMVARLAVTNDSSGRSTYSLEVSMESADGSQLATASAFVNNLEPDQSTETDAQSFTSAGGQAFTCRLVQVDRMASA